MMAHMRGVLRRRYPEGMGGRQYRERKHRRKEKGWQEEAESADARCMTPY